MQQPRPSVGVVIPAAGIGKRMQAEQPKQYLPVLGKTILERTLERFVDLDFVSQVVVALAQHDEHFSTLPISQHPKIVTVTGGVERADSVFSGIEYFISKQIEWVMVHDAARPCVPQIDIDKLYRQCIDNRTPGILAIPCRDTMKRAQPQSNVIDNTVDRQNLWHALTPQCAPTQLLHSALLAQVNEDGQMTAKVTDEASALEMHGVEVQLIEGSSRNIKVTLPEDLQLAELFIASES